MMRSWSPLFLLCALLLLIAAGCAESIDREVPPENAVFSVTDMLLTADGNYLLLLSSNFERAYDHGRVSVVDLAQGKVISSVLVDSLGGRLALTGDEKTLYVTTRESQALHRLDIMRDPLQDIPWLVYHDNLKLAEVTQTVRREPYAMALGESDRLLLVTHILNGEVAVFQRDSDGDTLAATFKMENGITDIIADEPHRIYLTTHKAADFLGVLRITADIPKTDETEGVVSAVTGTLALPLPAPGVDLRDIVPSVEWPSTYYLSYRDRDDSGYEYPSLLKIEIVENAGILTAERRWGTAVEGDLGEAAVVSCGSEPGMELVFVASPSEHTVTAYESFGGGQIARIKIDDCSPYQLHSRADDAQRRLFIDCFKEDRILVMQADCTKKDDLFTVGEVLP